MQIYPKNVFMDCSWLKITKTYFTEAPTDSLKKQSESEELFDVISVLQCCRRQNNISDICSIWPVSLFHYIFSTDKGMLGCCKGKYISIKQKVLNYSTA